MWVLRDCQRWLFHLFGLLFHKHGEHCMPTACQAPYRAQGHQREAWWLWIDKCSPHCPEFKDLPGIGDGGSFTLWWRKTYAWGPWRSRHTNLEVPPIAGFLATPGWSDQEEDPMSVTSTKIHVLNEEAKPIEHKRKKLKHFKLTAGNWRNTRDLYTDL